MKLTILEKFKLNFLKNDLIGLEVLFLSTTTEKGFNILDLGALSIESMWTFENVQVVLFKSY